MGDISTFYFKNQTKKLHFSLFLWWRYIRRTLEVTPLLNSVLTVILSSLSSSGEPSFFQEMVGSGWPRGGWHSITAGSPTATMTSEGFCLKSSRSTAGTRGTHYRQQQIYSPYHCSSAKETFIIINYYRQLSPCILENLYLLIDMQFNGDLRAYAYTAGAVGYSSQANVKEYFAAQFPHSLDLAYR